MTLRSSQRKTAKYKGYNKNDSQFYATVSVIKQKWTRHSKQQKQNRFTKEPKM